MSVENLAAVRVVFSSLEDARRVVFLELNKVRNRKLSDQERSRVASRIAAALRDAGVLGSGIEQHYSAAQVAVLCGQRTSAWAVQHAKAGAFGRVFFDGGNWLIPASGVRDYLDRHAVGVGAMSQLEVAA
jgi:hypothetical protein